MRRRTVRNGLRLLAGAVFLFILGAFYGREIGGLFIFSSGGAVEFVQLAFFWGGILGGTGAVMICAGLMQARTASDRSKILPSFLLVMIMVGLFFILFARALFSPPPQHPLRPGETLVI